MENILLLISCYLLVFAAISTVAYFHFIYVTAFQCQSDPTNIHSCPHAVLNLLVMWKQHIVGLAFPALSLPAVIIIQETCPMCWEKLNNVRSLLRKAQSHQEAYHAWENSTLAFLKLFINGNERCHTDAPEWSLKWSFFIEHFGL